MKLKIQTCAAIAIVAFILALPASASADAHEKVKLPERQTNK
jgi:hypothetical protein